MDASALLRTILENVFLIAAIYDEKIDKWDVFPGDSEAEMKDLMDYKPKDFRKWRKQHSHSVDDKVLKYIINNNKVLDEDEKEIVRWLRQYLHESVHRSQRNIEELFFQWSNNKKLLQIFPDKESKLGGDHVKFCLLLDRFVLMTMTLLQVIPEEFPKEWWRIYNVIDDGLKNFYNSYPVMIAKVLDKLIVSRFTFDI